MNALSSQSLPTTSLLNRAQDAASRPSTRGSLPASAHPASTPATARDLAAAMEQQNRAAAVSEITTIDLADAATQFMKLNFQSNASVATQSHANLAPQSVLRLLQG